MAKNNYFSGRDFTINQTMKMNLITRTEERMGA
jgi:hypothetical protein